MKMPKKAQILHNTAVGVVLGGVIGAAATIFHYERQTMLIITPTDAFNMFNRDSRGLYKTKFGVLSVGAHIHDESVSTPDN